METKATESREEAERRMFARLGFPPERKGVFITLKRWVTRRLGIHSVDFDKINERVAKRMLEEINSPEYRALREKPFLPKAQQPAPEGAEAKPDAAGK